MFDKAVFLLPGARRILVVLSLLTILRAAAVIGQAWSLAVAVDVLRSGGAWADAAIALAGFLVCFVGRQGVVTVEDWLLDRYASERSAELRQGLLQRVFDEGPLFTGKLGTGNTVTLALEGIEQVETYLRLVLPKTAAVVIIPFALLVFVFPFDWVSGVIMLVVFPFIIFYMILLGKTAKAEADKQQVEFRCLANHFVDSLRGIDTLKLFGRGKKHGASIFESSERFREATMKTLRTAILSGAVLDLFSTFSVAAVAIMLGFRLVDGSIAFFPALLVLICAPEYFKPIREFASDYHASLDGKIALGRLAVLVGPSAPADGAEATRRSAAQPSASCASLLQSDELIDGVQTVASAPSAGALGDEDRRTTLQTVTSASSAGASGDCNADVTNEMDDCDLRVCNDSGLSWNSDSMLSACDLEFAYEGEEHPALSGVSFSVRGFATVGLVGVSGSGKSTLVNLLGGFAGPSSGGFRVSLDGANISGGHMGAREGTSAAGDVGASDEGALAFSNLQGSWWKRQVTYIPQSPYIFHATLRENIAFYRPDASDDEVMQAAEVAGLSEIIDALPQGLDTPIGEGARALSGGQAQRIALARAFLDGSRRILLLDEPTAHLDIETELELKERMLPLMEGRLVVFATHRLHWLANMDAVLVMEGGRAVEFGKPRELLAAGGALARLAARMEGGA